MKKNIKENIYYEPQFRSPVLVLMNMEKRMAQVKTLMISLEQEIVALSVELQEAQENTRRSLTVTLNDNR